MYIKDYLGICQFLEIFGGLLVRLGKSLLSVVFPKDPFV